MRWLVFGACVLVACSTGDREEADNSGAEVGAEAGGAHDAGDGASPVWCETCSLFLQMQRLASPGSESCGTRAPSSGGIEDAGLDGVLTCVQAALQAGTPFTAVVEQQGFDSQVSSGWVLTAQGTLYRLSYDSNVCGGGGCDDQCGPRVSSSQCAGAEVVGGEWGLSCAASTNEQELCGPPEG
jgi:hypothetical protein